MSIPIAITEIQDFIAESALSLTRNQRDPRIDSATNEDEIISLIQSKFEVERPGMRAWYDLKKNDGTNAYPINIKVSNLHGNDNVQCKLGIYYSLTGVWPSFRNEISWENFFQKLSSDMTTDTSADYYFLVVNKENPSDVIATSLKSLQTLVPNGNNLPFQCHWGSNRLPKSRTHTEATKFVLANLKKSCDLRSRISSEFEAHLAKYI